jgi:hypothetical protein
MAMYAWHQRPAIDCLMNQYAENTHAQFGDLRMPRELSSVANQLGMTRTFCEVYGAGGWDLRFEDMKRIGDWLEVLGVNTLDQHLSYVTMRGARKRDHPQSFSYHEPWWEGLPRFRRVPRARSHCRTLPGRADQPRARPRTDDHCLDVSGGRRQTHGDRRFLLQASSWPSKRRRWSTTSATRT